MDDSRVASWVRSVAAGDAARSAVLALCDAISTGSSDARAAMNQWTALFGRACGRDLERPTADVLQAARSWAGGAFGGPPQTLLFAMHTYYALLVKTLVAARCRQAPWGDDLFSWCDAGRTPAMDALLGEVRARAAQCDDAILPHAGGYRGDLLRDLYQELLPRSLRHELGEYYTPDWLAEHVLDQVGYTGDPRQRLLDPACGSGTFLLAAIRRIRARCAAGFAEEGGADCGGGGQLHFRWDENGDGPRGDLCRSILANIVGCDINPVAVLAARANYLLALGDLLPDDPVSPPVVLCDSILDAPAGPLAVPFDFVVGNPPWIAWDNLPADYRRATQPLWEKYGLFSLSATAARHGGGKKDLAMLMIYAVADRFLRDSSRYVLPPCGAGESGAEREEDREGDSPIFAGAKIRTVPGAKIGTVPGGRLGMVLTQTAFQTKGAGDGFRRFRLGPDGEPLQVLRVDDMAAIKPFPEATNWTATLVLEKGAATQYPVPYVKWTKTRTNSDGDVARAGRSAPGQRNTAPDRAPSRADDSHPLFSVVRCLAEPIEPAQPGSPWFVRPPGLKAELAALTGPSDYTAHLGANSGGANGVFWLEVIERTAGGVLVRQIAADGARPRTTSRPSSSVHCIEPDLLYPLLRWGDVAPFRARPSAAILLSQDVDTRTGIAPAEMQQRYPRTLTYLQQFEDQLASRAAYRRYQDRKPFYSMYNVGPYTTAPVKVVWRRMDRQMRAAVVEEVDDPVLGRRPAIPQETCVLVAVESAIEAHYVCAVLNSAVVGFLVAAHSVSGGKGFGTPSVLDYLRLRRFDPHERRHAELASLSQAAHAAAAAGDAPTGPQTAIDRLAAELWGLDAGDLDAIQAEVRR